MTEEEYELMWELIDKAFVAGHGLGCDEDEVGFLIPDWKTIVYYQNLNKEEEP